MTNIHQIATIVDDAARNAKAIAQFSSGGNAFSLAEAYQIQNESMKRRTGRGERIVGVKMGFTSRAKAVQMGVHDLIIGQLTDAMLFEDGATASLGRFIHPRIEPEIAFLLKRPLEGRVTLLEAQAAVEAIAPALEVIDSRYDNFKFSLEDVVADNCSSSGLVIGAWKKVPDDISNLGMIMSFDGRPVQIGSSAGILGNPYRSLVSAARLAAQTGAKLEAGRIVMAGAATAAEPLKVGVYVSLEVEQLGCVELTAQA